MSRSYDTVEPNVIDDAMLKAAIEEQGPKEEAGQIARREGIHFEEVTQLRLDFKSTFHRYFYSKASLYKRAKWPF